MKKSKKLIIAINSSFNAINFRSGLIKALVKLNWDVTIVTPTDKYTEKLASLGCKHIDLKMDNKGTSVLRDLSLLVRLFLILRSEQPSIFMPYTIKPNIYGSLAANLLKIPVINNIAGLGVVFTKKNWLTFLVKTLYKFSLRKSKRIFFQNRNDFDEFIQNGLVRRHQCEVLPGSGVDLKYFAPNVLRDLKTDNTHININKKSSVEREDGFVFLMVARLIWEKGFREFVDAARVIIKEEPNTKFQILGFHALGPGAEYVENSSSVDEKIINSWVSESLIEFLGGTDDVRPFLMDCDCMVLPSYYREGTPKALLEAAAMARPIITTDWIGCRDIVDHGVNGFLCPARNYKVLADLMLKIIQLPKLQRDMMGQKSREKVEREYDENIVIKRYLQAVNNT